MSSVPSHANAVRLERVLKQYAEEFAQKNNAAKTLVRGLSLVGVGVRPLIDHFVFRTLHPKERAKEFLDLGYEKDPAVKILSSKGHSVEVYRRGCAAAILIEYPYDQPGQDWVKKFGDKAPYLLAVKVDDIDEAAFRLEKQAVGFRRPPAGKRDESLRQIATSPEMEEGMIVSYVALVERHAGEERFYAPDFWTDL